MTLRHRYLFFFFFNDTATTEISPLPLHDALPIFINDDWRVTPPLTLTLVLRYDLYPRHVDKYGHVTHFILPTGANLTERLRAANCFVDVSGATGFDGQPCKDRKSVV